MQKIVGAVLIILSCAAMGFSVANAHKHKERMLQQIIHCVQHMAWELQYRQTPLPQLVRMCAEQTTMPLSQFFRAMDREMEANCFPDAAHCVATVLAEQRKLPPVVVDKLTFLGSSLGRFDLQGQISGLDSVAQLCQRELDGLLMNRDVRLRSYATLGICAGVALVILFI